MATITLSVDTLISTLMPSGGGSLASGDTIQLAGHSLIVDADAVDYPVTIANSGGDANLELRDLGRIKLNATLPTTVHPWIDPANQLPADFEDESQYITGLTANARAEIVLANSSILGGGVAKMPTKTRNGAWYAKATGKSGPTITLDRTINCHVGDILAPISFSNPSGVTYRKIVAVDSANNTVTIDSDLQEFSVGYYFGIVAGGVVISWSGNGIDGPQLTAPFYGGTLNVVSNWNGNYLTRSSVYANRVCFVGFYNPSVNAGYIPLLTGPNSEIKADSALCFALYGTTYYVSQNNSSVSIGEIACSILSIQYPGNMSASYIGGGIVARLGYSGSDLPKEGFSTFKNTHFLTGTLSFSNFVKTLFCFDGCTLSGSSVDGCFMLGGECVRQNTSWYYSPATDTDIVWRYTPRLVPPGATLRLRCAWLREGSSATRASVAVTAPPTWWPSLWPLGVGALARVEFTGGTADWRSQLLSWRNTSAEAVTVRVWECVTGTVAGGYLRVEEVKGGQL